MSPSADSAAWAEEEAADAARSFPGEEAGSSPQPGPARPRPSGLPLLGIVVVAVGVLVRWALVAGRDPLTWQDTFDYLEVAGHGWLSPDLWIGERAPGPALLLKLTAEDHTRFMAAQILIAAACWGTLATVVADRLPGRRPRLVGGGAILAFSLADPLLMWDRSVLSESLALSGTALVAAACLAFLTSPTRAQAGLLVAALAWWSLIRDTHGVVVLLVATVAILAWVAARGITRPEARPARMLPAAPYVMVVTAALMIGGVSWLAASSAQRGDFPLRNVYQVRVLPYPDRVEWFASQGMPQAEAFLDPARPPVSDTGEAPVLWVPEDDPAFAEWSDWLASDGRRTFMLWVLTHPSYLVREPMATPERSFNNAEGDLSFYAAADQPTVPGPGPVLFPPTGVAVALASAAIVLGLLRPWRVPGPAQAAGTTPLRWREAPGGRDPIWIVGAALAGASVPHAALAWHADGMETARHVVVPAAQVRLGLLLLVIGLLAGWWNDRLSQQPQREEPQPVPGAPSTSP